MEAMAVPSNGIVIGTVGTKLNSRGKIEAGKVRARAVLEIPSKRDGGGKCREVPRGVSQVG